MQRYVVFNNDGTICGVYVDELCPINYNLNYALVSEELATKIANTIAYSVIQVSDIDKDKIYTDIDELVTDNPNKPTVETIDVPKSDLELEIDKLKAENELMKKALDEILLGGML